MMEKPYYFMVMLFFFLFGALPVFAEGNFQNYKNVRFGYTIDYPADLLTPQPESENGDGRHFVSTDGKADLAVWGEFPWEDDDSLEKRFSKDSTPSAEKSVTYKRKKENWYVVSGYVNTDTIYYMKVLYRKSDESYITFLFKYPKSQEGIYNPLIARIAKSFQ